MHSSKTRSKVRIIGFLVLLLVINGMMSWLLKAYSIMDVDFYQLSQGNVEELVVGSSHGLCGIDPQVLKKHTGNKTQNVCLGGEFLMDSFYIVKEAQRHRQLKRVIYELDPGYWVAQNNYNAVYQSFPASCLKVSYYLDRVLLSDFRMSLFPWYQYAHDYQNIPRIVKTKLTDSYRRRDAQALQDVTYYCKDNGFMYIQRNEQAEKNTDKPVLWERGRVKEENLEYFEKLTDFCEEEEISLVVVTLPIPAETLKQYGEAFESAYKYFKKLTENAGVAYYNFNYDKQEKMRLSVEDFNDYDGHMFGDTAAYVSEKLGELVAEN